jgi:N-formylglutamate amidohydrolase
MKKLILHIPHSSVIIPFLDGFVVDSCVIRAEIGKLTDWFTDDLFYSEADIKVKADFSRIFCDPERFVDDNLEEMSKYGMGVLYEQTDNGIKMREVNSALREQIISKYYLPHHKNLEESVKSELASNKKALIVDCHSFSNIPFNRDINKSPNRPNINIGTDAFHTPQSLIDFTVNFFNSKGLSVGVNWPYSGTIVPTCYYQKQDKVYSIMIEINRNLYLDSNTIVKSSNYNNTKQIIANFLNEIRDWLELVYCWGACVVSDKIGA